MKTPEHEDMEALERQVRPWLERRKIPLQKYRNLLSSYKVWLRDQLYGRTRLSDAQLRSLYRQLCSPAGRGSPDPIDLITSEQLQKFFSSLTPSEKLHYLEKF